MTVREVVITGVGVVSPIGIGREAFWTSLCEARSGVGELTGFPPGGLCVRFGAEVEPFDASSFVQPRKSLKLMSRDIQLSYVAAKLASRDAGLEVGQVDPDRFGVTFGADMMYCELQELVDVYRGCIDDGKFVRGRWGQVSLHELFPLWMLKYLPNMSACHIGIAHDARGPNNTIVQSEVSSLLALAEGMRAIERGRTDVMIVGGGSCRLHPTPLMSRCRSLYSHRDEDPAAASRPFDAQRDGMVNGEGAAAFVLEHRDHAKCRGANILAHVRSYACGLEPRHSDTLPEGTAVRRTLRQALDRAGLRPDQIGHANAHGLSTVEDDRFEAQAIASELGDVPVTAPKSFFGNLGAGGGAVEMAVSVLALEHGQVPATLNYEHPDPGCPVNVIHDNPLRSAAPTAVVLNHTTMGQAVAVVLAGGE